LTFLISQAGAPAKLGGPAAAGGGGAPGAAAARRAGRAGRGRAGGRAWTALAIRKRNAGRALAGHVPVADAQSTRTKRVATVCGRRPRAARPAGATHVGGSEDTVCSGGGDTRAAARRAGRGPGCPGPRYAAQCPGLGTAVGLSLQTSVAAASLFQIGARGVPGPSRPALDCFAGPSRGG